MEKIIAVTFDIADQKCKLYNALEWHNFIADTREQAEDPSAELEDLFDEVYGDEFWFEVIPNPFAVYQVAFDLRSETFVHCKSDAVVDFVMEMAADSGDEDEIFWAE
jgi:hypothetical protein